MHEQTSADHYAHGWWRRETLGEHVALAADQRPDGAAFIGAGWTWTWAEHDRAAWQVAARLAARELPPRSRVAVLLPDSPLVHAVYVGIERAGHIAVGIGPRAGRREIDHLVATTGAAALVAPRHHREHDMAEVVETAARTGGALRHLLVADQASAPPTFDGAALGGSGELPARPSAAPFSTEELCFLNSTSGTTGMPKVVMHSMNRWYAFHRMAVDAGELTADDVFMSVIPAPFGFGLWTAHFTPTLLQAPCVVLERFSAAAMIEAIERYRVTVLAAVSTQFVMMLNSPELAQHDVGSLRVMFTGGEAVPYERAAAFEEVTGASVLQFYGSNETGALSYTSTRDTREQRLRTAGRVIPVMEVRLFDDDGAEVTDQGGPGQPACRGPVTSAGYYGDPAATAQLVRPDGWMWTGDIVTVTNDGYLSVVGRKSDFIIRGGKNISAPAVEDAVLAVPGVSMAAAVAAPSAVYGEKVCVYVVPESGATVDLPTICAVLDRNGVTKEIWPEALVLVAELPIASGGKVAKAALREDVRRRVAAGDVVVDAVDAPDAPDPVGAAVPSGSPRG